MQPEHENEFSLHKDPFTKVIWLMNVVNDVAEYMEVSEEAKVHLDDVYEGLHRLLVQLKKQPLSIWR